MRLREGVLLAAVVGMALTGCSRLTFVKPDAQRRGGERVAPEYAFKETEASRQRTRARHLVASAGQKYAAGTLDAAAADARAALKIDPTQAAAHTMLGLVAGASGDTGAAGTHYARAAELAPGDGLVLNNYGAWLCGNGQAAAALGWFDQALQDPAYAEREAALSNVGACAAKAGRHDLVEAPSRAALEIAPENVVALQTLSEHTFNAGRYLEARAFSQRRLASAPATPDALRLASQIEEKLGDTVAATRYVQRLNTEFPQARNAGPGEAELP